MIQLNDAGALRVNTALELFNPDEYNSADEYPLIVIKVLNMSEKELESIYEDMKKDNASNPMTDDDYEYSDECDDCKSSKKKKKLA